MTSRTSSLPPPARLRCRKRSRAAGSASSTFVAPVLASLLILSSAGLGAGPVSAAVAAGTSDAGIVPVVIEGGPGGNVGCEQVPSDVTLDSSDRLEWRGGRLIGTIPDGLEVSVVDDRVVTWSSESPIVAVIVKGGPAANVYLTPSTLRADSGLVAPVVASGQSADISNVTFCWDPDPIDPPEVDLQQVCMDAAMSIDVGPIVSVAGPVGIRDGSVVLSSVPDGLLITFDAESDQVGFVAPFPVVIVVTASSAHRIHHIVPASTSGTVPLSSNSGHGEVVLCGLDAVVVAGASCTDVGADRMLDPVTVRDGVIDPDELPEGIVSMEVTADGLLFASAVPIVGLLVTASASELHRFEEPVLSGLAPLALHHGEDIALQFCALRLTIVSEPDPDPVPDPGPDPGSTPTSEQQVTAAQDPVLIATGGGPPARAPIALFAFVVLSLVVSATMLLRSRSS